MFHWSLQIPLAHANGLGEGACVTELHRDGVGCLSIIPKDTVTQRGKCTVVFFIKSASKSVMMPVAIFDVVTPTANGQPYTATEMVLDRSVFQLRVLDRLAALLKTTPGPALLLENFFATRYSNRDVLPAYRGFTARAVAGKGLVLLGSWHDVLGVLGGGAGDATGELHQFFAPTLQVRGEPVPLRPVQVSYVTLEVADTGNDEEEVRLFHRVRRVARSLAPTHVIVDGQAAGDHKYEFVFHGDTFSEMRIVRQAWSMVTAGHDMQCSLKYGTRYCKSPAWDARGLTPGTSGSTKPGRMGRLSAAASTLARIALSAMQLADCRGLPLSGCLASIGIARALQQEQEQEPRPKSPPLRSLEEYRLAPTMSMDEAAAHLQEEGVLTSDFFAGAGGELYAKKLDEQRRKLDALKKRFAQGMASSGAVAPLQMQIRSQSEQLRTQQEELAKSRRANKRLRDEQAEAALAVKRIQQEKQRAEARAAAIEADFMKELRGLSEQVEEDEAIRKEAERIARAKKPRQR
jgi:hypothetical protein